MGQHGGTYQGIVGFQYENGPWALVYGDGSAWIRNNNLTLTAEELNTWVHFAGVIKAGTGGYIKVYKNGVEITPQTNVSTAISHLTTFDIGRAYTAAGRYFNGLIDAVHIYNRALSADEISHIYAAGPHIRAEENPSYSFQEGTWKMFLNTCDTHSPDEECEHCEEGGTRLPLPEWKEIAPY